MNHTELNNPLHALLGRIKKAIDETQTGVPGGTIYAALMQYGCTLEQYDAIMGALVSAGQITRKGDLYYPVGK